MSEPKKKSQSKPLFVAISDIHFNLNTLEVATLALQASLRRAESLKVPLVIAGDLNDSKDIIRAKVANRIISILEGSTTKIYILEGNHDKVNEKSSEHGLNYLRPYATIIDKAETHFSVHFVPYQSDSEEFVKKVKSLDIQKGSILVVHQGFLGAFMGDYIQDKTSVSPDAVECYTVISGHYHKHQTVESVIYIGSPYTVTFGEANDGDKGFLVVNTDGSYTQEALPLRRHVILERTTKELNKMIIDRASFLLPKDSIVWLKISGTNEELQQVDKKYIADYLLSTPDFKLDLIPEEKDEVKLNVSLNLSKEDLLDMLIEELSSSTIEHEKLKSLWRDLIS